MACTPQMNERLKQQLLITDSERQQQQRFLAELQHQQRKEVLLNKKNFSLGKETMKNEMIAIGLLRSERQNIARINSFKSELRDLTSTIDQYQKTIEKSRKIEYNSLKKFLQRKLSIELEIQSFLRKKDFSDQNVESDAYSKEYRTTDGETLSNTTLIENLRRSIEEEKLEREELAVKNAVLKQDVDRLKCLTTCSGNIANENEEKRLQSHQTDMEKAEEQAHLSSQVEINAMKISGRRANIDETNENLTEVQNNRQQLQIELENLEHCVKTLRRRMVILRDEEESLQKTACALAEERIELDRKRKAVRNKTIAHVSRL